MPVLSGCWDVQKYAEHHSEADHDFSPQKLSATLQDGMFLAYLRFIDHLESVPEQLALWAESCDCHNPMAKQQRLSPFEKTTLIKKHFQGKLLGCCCCVPAPPSPSTFVKVKHVNAHVKMLPSLLLVCDESLVRKKQ